MTKVNVNIVSTSGETSSCEIEYEITQGNDVIIYIRGLLFDLPSIVASNIFEALIKVRLEFEKHGYLLLCNAARRDAYPSRMSLAMGGGQKIYLLKFGRQASPKDLVDVFGTATADQVGTVKEQRANYEAWLKSL